MLYIVLPCIMIAAGWLLSQSACARIPGTASRRWNEQLSECEALVVSRCEGEVTQYTDCHGVETEDSLPVQGRAELRPGGGGGRLVHQRQAVQGKQVINLTEKNRNEDKEF